MMSRDLPSRSDFLDIPLEDFVRDVPDHKLFVLSNYRSMFTNIFFIRNNERGRMLAYDWLAIVKSGNIQCHGFDQVRRGQCMMWK